MHFLYLSIENSISTVIPFSTKISYATHLFNTFPSKKEPRPTEKYSQLITDLGQKVQNNPDLLVSNSKKSSKPAGAMSKGYRGWLQGASNASLVDNINITKIMKIS